MTATAVWGAPTGRRRERGALGGGVLNRQPVAGRHDMHRTHLNALAVIMRHAARGETVTPGVLRKELNLGSPAITALIDRLHGSGHVVRERKGPDRRQVQLRMTPKAYRLHARLRRSGCRIEAAKRQQLLPGWVGGDGFSGRRGSVFL